MRSPRRGLTRHALVAGQITLCVLLVSGAGLLGRTLRQLVTRDAGFDRANVLMFTLETSGTSFDAAGMPTFCDALIERMKSVHRAVSGSCSTSVPVHTRGNARPLVVPDAPERPVDQSLVFMNRISPEYFRAQGIRIVDGRALDATDSEGSEKVALISRSAARFFFGDGNPIGRRVHFFRDEKRLMTVVGVVDDAHQWNLRDAPFMTVYTPLTQLAEAESNLTVSLRTAGDPADIAGLVREEVRALGPDVIVDYVRTMEEQIAGSLVRERILAILSSSFGLVALLLSCVGLYGVIAYDVTLRRHELGIRFALGGGRAAVVGGALRKAADFAGLGIVLGLAATLASTRVLSTWGLLIEEVQPRDPVALSVALGLIVLTCLLATYLPARRASAVDPALVMRTE